MGIQDRFTDIRTERDWTFTCILQYLGHIHSSLSTFNNIINEGVAVFACLYNLCAKWKCL